MLHNIQIKPLSAAQISGINCNNMASVLIVWAVKGVKARYSVVIFIPPVPLFSVIPFLILLL